jgi:isopentenyl diphosphate isomerase/L-lactate dehydrogenase-like FMN-dependent dehydrogenase
VRPVLHGVLVAGAEGAAAVLRHLREEPRLAMALAGVRSVAVIGPDLVATGPPGL